MGTAAFAVYPATQEGVLHESAYKRQTETVILPTLTNRRKICFFGWWSRWVEREGITEKHKAEQPMEWVSKMNALREAATEIVNVESDFCIN